MDNNGTDSVPAGVGRCQLVLDFDQLTFALNIGGSITNLDVAIAMLDQAKRHFEKQLRIDAAVELAQKVDEAKLTGNVRSMLSRGGR